MRLLTLLLLAAEAPILVPESAMAQAPPERAALAALRDSVADVDAGVIERLRAGASRGSPASRHDTLRLALLERRLAETSGNWSWLDSAEIRVERLLRDYGEDSVIAYPMRFRLIAERSDGAVVRLDTTRLYATRRVLDDDEFLTGQLAMRAPPGEYRLTVVLGDADWEAGARAGIAGLHVPGAEPLAMSDLVLGRERSGQVWNTGDVRVPLNPLNTYPEGGAVEVYYQLRGLDVGTRYRTTIEVHRREAQDREPSVRVGFDDVAAEPIADLSRTVGLGRLRRGEYVLSVTIAAPDGSSVRRRQFLNVTSR